METELKYKLFPTGVMWNFVKLDTSNGKMWQVQFGIDNSSPRCEEELNSLSLAGKDIEISGRFTLYPTTNFYNLILLDQITGATYQVQWSTVKENRLVIPIT